MPENVDGRDIAQLLVQECENADEVWAAWHSRRCPPPLKTISGLTIHHNWPEDPVYLLFREIFLSRCYTQQGFFNPEPGDTVIDIGANIGVFVLFISGLAPGIRVHCFEPSGGTFQRLRKNIIANNLERTVSLYQVAIWEKDCHRELLNHRCSGRRSFFEDVREQDTGISEIVQCITLSAALERVGDMPIDLLKIDAEGAEVEILRSGGNASWARIKRLTLEYHEELRPGSRGEIFDLLRSCGFNKIRDLADSTGKSAAIGIVQAERQ